MVNQAATDLEIDQPRGAKGAKKRRLGIVGLRVALVLAAFNLAKRRKINGIVSIRGSIRVLDHAATAYATPLINENATIEGLLPTPRGLAYSWPLINNMTEALCEQDSVDELHVPTFIIPGAQKAGTSALYKLLSMHPHVISSRRFEVRRRLPKKF